MLQTEWLKTAKPSRTRLPILTVVRLPDGVESYGPLRAGQLAIIASDDGSSWPYNVRTSDGVLHDTSVALRGLVEVEGGTVSESARGAARRVPATCSGRTKPRPAARAALVCRTGISRPRFAHG